MSIVTVRITRSLQVQLSSQMPLFNALARLSKKQIRVSSSLLSHSLDNNISPRLLTMVLERVNNAFPNAQSFDHRGLMNQFSALKQEGIEFGGMFEKTFIISRKRPKINDLFQVIEQDGEKVIVLMDDLQTQEVEFEDEALPPTSTALAVVGAGEPRQEYGLTPPGFFGSPQTGLVLASQAGIGMVTERTILAMHDLLVSADPKEIIRGLRSAPAYYKGLGRKKLELGIQQERIQQLEKEERAVEEALFTVFFRSDQQVREEVVSAFEGIDMPQEFTDHLRRFVTGNDSLKAVSLDKLFDFSSKYQGENDLPLQMVRELIFEQIQNGTNKQVIEKALELLCQVRPGEDITSIRDALEERFNRNPGVYDALIEKAFRYMAGFKRPVVIESLEQALANRSRIDFHVIAARILLDLYEQVGQKEVLLQRILLVLANDPMSASVRTDLEQIVANSGEMAVPVLMQAYDEMTPLFRPTAIKLVDAIVCAKPVSAETFQTAGELLQREIGRGARGISTAMETGMIHLPGFPATVRAQAYKESLDVLFDIRHNQNAINNVVTHGYVFLSRIVKKAVDERQDQQKHKFFVHLAALIISKIDTHLPFLDNFVLAALQMASTLYFIKEEPDALADICLIVSSSALDVEVLTSLISGTVARESVEKILPAESPVWGQAFVDPSATRLKFKPDIAETLERLGQTEKSVRQLLAIYKKTLFKDDEAPLSPDELAILVAIAKNTQLTEKAIKQIVKKLTTTAKNAFNQKEQADDMPALMEAVLANRASVDVGKILGANRSFRLESEMVKDYWEIFIEAIQGLVNLILNPAVERKHDIVTILFEYHVRLKGEQSLKGIFIIESAFVQLLLSGSIAQLPDRERIIGLLEDRFVGERSMDIGLDYIAQLWRMLNRDVSSWANLGERLNGFLERLLRKISSLRQYERKPVLEFLSRTLDAFSSKGTINPGLLREEIERIIKTILS